MCVQAKKILVSFFEAEEQAAAVEASAGAQDCHEDVASGVSSDGAGGSAVGARRSKRASIRKENGCSASTSTATLCEIRKAEGVVYVPAAVPVQGGFCSAKCAGEGGKCGNQVPAIATDDNVEVSAAISDCGKFLTAKRDIAAGEIFTVFGGAVLKKRTHAKSYSIFSDMKTLQQLTGKSQPKFEYSAHTGRKDSEAWVIPPEDMPLLRENIQCWSQQNTHLHNLVKHSETWQQGLGQFAQHTCCENHVNSYLFPICIMRAEPRRQRGSKRAQEAEVMDFQALGLRALKDIGNGEEILVHYMEHGKLGDLWFDCRCCQCVGPCRRE